MNIFLILKILTSSALADIGTAVSYDLLYTPTRCYQNDPGQFPSGNLFISVSEGLWDNGAACGRRCRLKCISGQNKPCVGSTIDVRVLDYCEACPATMKLSNDAFAQIASPGGGINVEYMQI
ncbi:EG45-like domain containing protein 2, partial [Cercospora beticola]